MKVVVAVGGASGSIYAKRLLDVLAARPAGSLEVGLVFSNAGAEVWAHEIGAVPEYPFRRYGLRDFRAPFASGSAGWDAMVVIPCSAGGLARIAHGISDDLLARAADVMIKERKKLILVARETPLSEIHLSNMLTVTRAGAMVLPATPSFYKRPQSIDDLVRTVTSRVLDHLGIDDPKTQRWGDKS